MIVTSTYDLYLLIMTTKEAIGVVSIQTDDILILGSKEFSNQEEDELKEAKFTIKPKEKLSPEIVLMFNRYILI